MISYFILGGLIGVGFHFSNCNVKTFGDIAYQNGYDYWKLDGKYAKFEDLVFHYNSRWNLLYKINWEYNLGYKKGYTIASKPYEIYVDSCIEKEFRYLAFS